MNELGAPFVIDVDISDTDSGMPIDDLVARCQAGDTQAVAEMVTVYALQCMERLIMTGEKSVDVKEDVYWRYNRRLDERRPDRKISTSDRDQS